MATKAIDPYYARKPVPDSLIEGTGVEGLTREQALETRERKLSQAGPGGSDLRRFSNFLAPKGDPYYHRKKVPDNLVEGTGVDGLTQEQALEARERKLSTAGKDGSDARRFSNFLAPKGDPYYNRKSVSNKIIQEQAKNDDADPIETYENRERKLSMFTLTNDPFDQVAGRRTSTVGDSALGVGRRRSSAVAPDHTAAAARATRAHEHDGGHLEPIESRPEGAPTTTTTTRTTTTTDSNTFGSTRHEGLGEQHHGLVHDRVTNAGTSEESTVAGSEPGHHTAI